MPYLKRWPHTYQEESLATWRTARDNAANEPVDIVYYGNSLTQDGGSPVSFFDGGYPRIVGDWMNAKLGKRHGVGYEVCRTGQATSRWSVSGLSTSTELNTVGFGLMGLAMAPGTSATWSGVTDRVDVLYTKTKTNGSTLQIRVDGILVDSLSTLDAAQAGTYDSSNTWTSIELPLTTHSVNVTNSGSNTIHFEGIYAYQNNYDAGFRFWNGARSGSWGAYNNGLGGLGPTCYDIITKRQPALVVWGHFHNERNVSLNSYNSNTAAFITAVRNRSPDSSILLCTEWQNASWTPALAATYAELRASAAFIAAVNGIGVIDLGEFIESVGYDGVYDDPLLWVDYVDGDITHQSREGFLQWARIHHAYLNDIKPPVRPQHL